jgi:hypothetical protein
MADRSQRPAAGRPPGGHSGEPTTASPPPFGPPFARVVAGKEAVGQAEHAPAQRGRHVTGQSPFVGGKRPHPRRLQHMGSVLQQGHETELGISAFAPAGSGPPIGLLVVEGVGHVQRAAVQADQAPIPVPSPLGAFVGDRANQASVESAQRLGPQAAARPRNAGRAGRLPKLDAGQLSN